MYYLFLLLAEVWMHTMKNAADMMEVNAVRKYLERQHFLLLQDFCRPLQRAIGTVWGVEYSDCTSFKEIYRESPEYRCKIKF